MRFFRDGHVAAELHEGRIELIWRNLESLHSATPRPNTVTTGPLLDFNLKQEIDKLHAEDAWQAGKNSKTLVKYPDYRIVLIVMHKSARMTEDHAAGRISVQTLSGRIKMHVSEAEIDMPAGALIALDRAVSHDVEALEESAFLVTIAWPEHLSS